MGGEALLLVAVTAPVVVAALACAWSRVGRRRGPRPTPSAVELAMVAGGDDRDAQDGWPSESGDRAAGDGGAG